MCTLYFKVLFPFCSIFLSFCTTLDYDGFDLSTIFCVITSTLWPFLIYHCFENIADVVARPPFCHRYHRLYPWRKICHVEKFQISVKNLNNLWSFIEIHAFFVLNLCGEKMTNMRSGCTDHQTRRIDCLDGGPAPAPAPGCFPIAQVGNQVSTAAVATYSPPAFLKPAS